MSIKNVLIVEDDSRIAGILLKTIEKMTTFSVIAITETAVEAIDVIDCFSPDLIFIDVSLLDSSGLDVLQHIKQSIDQPAACVVMLTAAKDPQIIQTSIASGVFDYILKPISFNRLTQTLQRYLDYCARLDSKLTFEQKDVDLLLGAKISSEQCITNKSDHPKGIDSLTLDKILAVIKKDPLIFFTADVMSDTVGTSRTTARRYLEYLLSINSVRAEIEYGTVGRPERRYVCK